jgi:AbiU2
MKPRPQKLDLDGQIDIARNQLVRARIFLDIWWHYHGSPTRGQSLGSMNEFPEFFRFDEHAHFTAFIVHIATLFDKRNDTVRLEKLEKTISNKLTVSAEIKRELKALFQQVNIIAAKVLILRHNAFAHRSNQYSYNEAFKLANVSSDEFLVLTEKSKQILNLFLQVTKREEVAFWDLPREDLVQMLTQLKPSGGNAH